MIFSSEERAVIVLVLNTAAVAVRDTPEAIPSGKDDLLPLFSAAIDFARGLDDLLTLASLIHKVDQILEASRFPSIKDIEVVVPGFGGGVVATTATLAGIQAPERQTVKDALLFVKWSVEAEFFKLRPEHSRITIPAEKVAPFHYSFDDNRLTVRKQPAGAPLEDVIASARALLVEQGARLLEDLRKSNSDRRLYEAFAALHQKITEGQDIVQLGLLNITLEGAIRGAEAEISGSLAEVLRGHAIGVRYYLAQFPEWVQFSDSAAELELTGEDLVHLKTGVGTLAGTLEAQASVDQEVPRTLRLLANVKIDSPTALRRAALAIMRTLQNLAIPVFRRAKSFLGTTVDRTLDKASMLIAEGLAHAIAITVLHSAAALLLSADAAWLIPAAAVISRSADKLGGK